MHWLKALAALFSLLLLMAPQLSAQGAALISVGEAPENHVWDRDNLYRIDPDALRKIETLLIDLEEETGLEVYLVTYSSAIGEKLEPLAMRCHDEWLGEKDDGLVIALSFNQGTSGAVGRSRKLYENQFIDAGIMPRVSFVHLETIMKGAIAKLRAEEGQFERVQVFTREMTEQLQQRLEITGEADEDVESYHFMGWMAIALLGTAIVVGLLSKVMGSTGLLTDKVYHFPDFTVEERLKGQNGGGKISVIDFGSPPSSDGQ